MAKFPTPGFNFVANLPDIGRCEFQEINGLKGSMEFQEVRSGGYNNLHFKIPTKATYGDITLKRGIFWLVDTESSSNNKDALDKIAKYLYMNDPVAIKFPSKSQLPDISISLNNEAGLYVASWQLVNPSLLSWEISAFNAQNNELAFETLTFSCSEIKYSNYERAGTSR